MIFKVVLSLVLCGGILAQSDDYDGYKIYDVYATAELVKEALLRFSKNPDFDFFSLPRALDEPARVMVQPSDQADFELTLSHLRANFSVIDGNVGESVRLERMQNAFMRSMARNRNKIGFQAFYRFDEINAYLDYLAVEHPSRVHVRTVGKSYEGRDIKIIFITNGEVRTNKKLIFVDAGIHAREWIAPATALYIIHQLVENFENNEELLKDYNWVILPVFNPDGYEFTHTGKRLWRKTRKPVTERCIGTDGNRNFDFHWGGEGASDIPCSEVFQGTHAFSEPETMVVRDIMLGLQKYIKFYLTLHSYGKYLLYPWGYASDLPENWEEIDRVAKAGAAAIYNATGTRYRVGSSTNLLGEGAGGSDDYALAVAGIPISITMELPPGKKGFIVFEDQIQPFVEEAWVGIKAMAKAVIDSY